MTNEDWCEKYGAIRDRFMEYYKIDVHRGFTGMIKEGCWCSGFSGDDPTAVIGLMLDKPIKVTDTFEGVLIYQWKTPNENERPIRIYNAV